ncbi:MAG: tyrosine--tRNA ligase [Phycisphaerae bacterium]|jgi:tyrosyl-tRNA synthetase
MINTDELLSRAVEDVVPRKLAEEKLKSGKPLRLYLGIDPTGAKLHIGHSVPLLKLRAFQDAGHHVIFLIGSFTALIGDPTGREETRPMLTKEEVTKNFETYKQQASKILDFDSLEIRYNDEWLAPMGIADIMKLAGHFTIQQMMQRDMFQKRLAKGDPLTPNEFMYPLMQGYDSVVLDVDFEVGGNDQLFNMLCGRTLQKAYGKREKFVLTTRLIEGIDGRKMSKSYDNCIYLTDAPGEMYGKILSIKDELIPTYFECCTKIPMAEVNAAVSTMKAGKMNPKDLKMRLAREIVTMYHSKKDAAAAEAEFENVFKNKGLPESIPEFKAKKGMLLIDALAESKTVSSKSEARRLIEQGGVKLADLPVTAADAKAEKGIWKVGKRKFLKITN